MAAVDGSRAEPAGIFSGGGVIATSSPTAVGVAGMEHTPAVVVRPVRSGSPGVLGEADKQLA